MSNLFKRDPLATMEEAAHPQAERDEARRSAPEPPPLDILLAQWFAERSGEDWTALSPLEREVRIDKMASRIRGAPNTHYH